MWGGRENPLVISDLCDLFLLLHMAHSLYTGKKFKKNLWGQGMILLLLSAKIITCSAG